MSKVDVIGDVVDWRVFILPFVLTFILLSTVPLFAQEGSIRPAPVRPTGSATEIGVKGGYDFDVDGWTLGGQLRTPLSNSSLSLLFGGDAIFEDEHTGWQFTTDVSIPLNVLPSLHFGGGFTLLNRDFDNDGDLQSEAGGSAFLTLRPDRAGGGVEPALEGRWSFVEGTRPFRLTFSLNFPAGSR